MQNYQTKALCGFYTFLKNSIKKKKEKKMAWHDNL